MAPPLRPVCGCNVGPGTRLGELLCVVLERVADTKVIDRKQYSNIVTLLNSHASLFAEFLQVGADHEHHCRVHSAVVARDPPPPTIYGLRKDHKPTREEWLLP